MGAEPGVAPLRNCTRKGKHPTESPATEKFDDGGVHTIICSVAVKFGDPPPLIVKVTVYVPGLLKVTFWLGEPFEIAGTPPGKDQLQLVAVPPVVASLKTTINGAHPDPDTGLELIWAVCARETPAKTSPKTKISSFLFNGKNRF
jgi:hypothetical protein